MKYLNYKIMLIFLILTTLLMSSCSNKPQQEDTIKIGVAMPLTGYASINGEADYKAIMLAADTINSRGGINGKKIQLIVEDYQTDKKQVVSVYKKLIEVDKVQAIIGPVWTVFAEPIYKITDEAEIPTIMTDGDAKYETLAGYGDYFFTTWYPVFGGHDILLDFIKQSGKSKIAIVYDDGSPYSLEMAALFKESALKNGFIVFDHQTSFTAKDFKTDIAKMLNEKPDFIYAPFSDPARQQIFTKQSIEQGLDSATLVGVEFAFEQVIAEDYNNWKSQVIFAYPQVNPEKYPEFQKAFEEKYGPVGQYPSSISNAYDAVMVLAKALEKNPSNGKELRRELLNIKDFQGYSQSSLEFDEQGIVKKPEYVLKIWKEGKFIPID